MEVERAGHLKQLLQPHLFWLAVKNPGMRKQTRINEVKSKKEDTLTITKGNHKYLTGNIEHNSRQTMHVYISEYTHQSY